MYKIKEPENYQEELSETTEISNGTYVNGIIEILFILSILVSVKYPMVLFFSLLVALTAILVNVKLLMAKKVK